MTVLWWLGCVGLAGAAPLLWHATAVAVFWVPVNLTDPLRGSWPGWLAAPATALVWLLWAVVVAKCSGMMHALPIHRQGAADTTRYSDGFRTYTTTHTEWYISEDHTVLPLRTGLRPLLRLSRTRVLGAEESTSGDGYHDTTSLHQYIRLSVLEFPPTHFPLWLRSIRRVVAKWSQKAQ